MIISVLTKTAVTKGVDTVVAWMVTVLLKFLDHHAAKNLAVQEIEKDPDARSLIFGLHVGVRARVMD